MINYVKKLEIFNNVLLFSFKIKFILFVIKNILIFSFQLVLFILIVVKVREI